MYTTMNGTLQSADRRIIISADQYAVLLERCNKLRDKVALPGSGPVYDHGKPYVGRQKDLLDRLSGRVEMCCASRVALVQRLKPVQCGVVRRDAAKEGFLRSNRDSRAAEGTTRTKQ